MMELTIHGTETPIWGMTYHGYFLGLQTLHRIKPTEDGYKTRCNGTSPEWQSVHDARNAQEWLDTINDAPEEKKDDYSWFHFCNHCFGYEYGAYHHIVEDAQEARSQ